MVPRLFSLNSLLCISALPISLSLLVPCLHKWIIWVLGAYSGPLSSIYGSKTHCSLSLSCLQFCILQHLSLSAIVWFSLWQQLSLATIFILPLVLSLCISTNLH